jgi:hypothetical protein
MSVYVDRAKHKYRRMLMCHMLADTNEELFAMADLIGIHHKWFQPLSHPHFDICQSKRKLAVLNGAIEVDNRQLVAVMNRYRNRFNAAHAGLVK